MASLSGGAPLRIDQAVHGYDHGHRLIRASRLLDEQSGQLMRATSDLLTPHLLVEGSSYLAGYPLKDSTAYVLARTWPAPEMPRPGSVWTHSLIIDYQTLTKFEDAATLVSLLRRPTETSLDRYSVPLAVVTPSLATFQKATSTLHIHARTALAKMYAASPSTQVIVATASSANDEALALALWRQAWPALRRDMAFVTGVNAKLPFADVSCVIRFEEAITINAQDIIGKKSESPDTSDELDLLLTDLPIRGPTDLRNFIGRHAFDAVEPRAAVLTLARLWKRLENVDAEELVEAVEAARHHTGSPRLIRDIIERFLSASVSADELTNLVEKFGSLNVSSPIRSLERVDYTTIVGDLTVTLQRSARCESGTVGAQVFAWLADNLPVVRLIEGHLDVSAVLRILERRPELVVEYKFWPRDDSARALLTKAAIHLGASVDIIAAIVGVAPGPHSLAALVETWPDAAPEKIVRLLDNQNSSQNAAFRSRAAIASFLGRSPEVLGKAVDNGARLTSVVAEDVAAAALEAGTTLRLSLVRWEALCRSTPDLTLTPHLAAAIFVAGRASDDALGTDAVLRSFPPLVVSASKHTLPRMVESYLREVLRSGGVVAWSTADGIVELSTQMAVAHGKRYDGLLAAVSDRRQLDTVLDTIHRLGGILALHEFARSAMLLNSNSGSWKSERTRDYIKSKEKRTWIW